MLKGKCIRFYKKLAILMGRYLLFNNAIPCFEAPKHRQDHSHMQDIQKNTRANKKCISNAQLCV